jgi:hypothetical protein
MDQDKRHVVSDPGRYGVAVKGMWKRSTARRFDVRNHHSSEADSLSSSSRRPFFLACRIPMRDVGWDDWNE